MSVVSNPALLSSGIHGQQLGSSSTGILNHGDCLEGHGAAEFQAKGNAESDGLVNNNCHITSDGGDSVDIGAYSAASAVEEVQDDAPVIDIIINNVVCTFSTRCHLNLKKIAMEGAHVEYKRENGMLNMKLRRPNTTATIWSSGKITCTGSTSEDEAKLAARRIARRLQKLGFNIRFSSYRVVNVLGTCSLPFGIKLNQFSEANRENASYEPELHPGVTYRIKDPKATLKIFSTGSITVTAPCVLNIQLAIEHIYPIVCQYRMERRIDKKVLLQERKYIRKGGTFISHPMLDVEDDEMDDEDFDDESDDLLDDDFESDVSQD